MKNTILVSAIIWNWGLKLDELDIIIIIILLLTCDFLYLNWSC